MPNSCNISVIVVSRDRPDHLQQMLACLCLQDISGFETIVVTNTPSVTGVGPVPARLTFVSFEEANISAARNKGIEISKGDFVVFCDDDALPDPGWLRLITAVFDNPEIGGAGGFTRGRNGISPQWNAVLTDGLAQETPISMTKSTEFDPSNNSAPVMIGTNCAFRKSALTQIGYFDESFAYYLDDSDISLRLSKAGWKLAILPHCQVHHSFAQNSTRSKRRIPISLMTLGHSKAYFCRKHGASAQLSDALAQFEASQLRKIDSLVLLGLLNGVNGQKLHHTLRAGFDSGKEMAIRSHKPLARRSELVSPVIMTNSMKHVVLAGRQKNAEWLSEKAQTLTHGGYRVTVIMLTWSALYMQVTFEKAGFWLHKGGQFGKIQRNEPIWQWMSFKQKITAECQRLHRHRPIDIISMPELGEYDASLLPQKFGKFPVIRYKDFDDSMFD